MTFRDTTVTSTNHYKIRGIRVAGCVAEKIDKVLKARRASREELSRWLHVVCESGNLVVTAAQFWLVIACNNQNKAQTHFEYTYVCRRFCISEVIKLGYGESLSRGYIR